MITYCTNIHPGETWAEITANVRAHAPAVRAAVSPGRPFPVGLRLSNRATLEAGAAQASAFGEWCESEGLAVETLNGFPFGRFHGAPVKEQVYLPDWRHPQRLAYTERLADLLAGWLPTGRRGSISTVPLGYRRFFGPGDRASAEANLRSALEHLEAVGQRTGKEIVLSLEPEPGCLLETSEDAARLFADLAIPAHLRRHLALCYDCCHQALQFEDPAASLALLADAGVPLGQVQISSALSTGTDLEAVARFDEPVYLHQTVGRRADGGLARFADLPEALAAGGPGVAEWRVHFHVPVFVEEVGGARTTRPFLEAILPLLPPGTPCEVETYTWSVLPPDLRTATVTDSIVREIEWAREASGAGRRVSSALALPSLPGPGPLDLDPDLGPGVGRDPAPGPGAPRGSRRCTPGRNSP